MNRRADAWSTVTCLCPLLRVSVSLSLWLIALRGAANLDKRPG